MSTHYPILVSGSTGRIGQHLQAIVGDLPVKWAVRRDVPLKNTIRVDFSKSSINIAGCKTLFLNSAAVPDQYEQNKKAIDAAIESGYEWIIRVSASDAADESNVPWVTAHAAADRYLQSKNIKWTILKPSAFMSNLFEEAGAIRRGFLPQIAGDGKIAWVDAEDIARVACQLFRDGPEKHQNKVYMLTGPELVSYPEVAKMFSKYHTVRYVHLPDQIFGLILRLASDKWTSDALVAQFAEIIRPGLEGVEVSNDIEHITGRKATSIQEFIHKHYEKQFAGFDALPYMIAVAAMTAAIAAYNFGRW